MRERGVGALLSLLRQGLALEIGFGTRSVEALLWVAETVEEAVYAPGSMVRTERGVRFELSNPPLRAGAFGAVRAWVDGTPVDPRAVSVREGAGTPWRAAASISQREPLALRPGQAAEVRLEPVTAPGPGRLTVRLELESVAIPPLVWLEFSDEVREPGGPA